MLSGSHHRTEGCCEEQALGLTSILMTLLLLCFCFGRFGRSGKCPEKEIHLLLCTHNFATMAIVDISNDAAAASLLESSSGEKSVLFFWAEWHAPSNSGGPFDTVVKTLAQQNDGSVKFYRVLAEECPKLSQKVCRLIS